jgi:hypothetical protein
MVRPRPDHGGGEKGSDSNCVLNIDLGWAQWLVSVIPAIWEVEIWEDSDLKPAQAKLSKTPFQHKSLM